MKFQHLLVFRTVYEKASVSEAARTLNTSQPPVSRMLRTFEDSIGVKLFVRDHGRMVPTPEADLLYEEAVSVFERVDRFAHTAEDARTGRWQRLTISTAISLGYTLLPPALKRFRGRYPDTPVEVGSGTLRDQLLALEHDDIDLSLSFSAPQKSGIKRIALGEGDLVVIMPLDHPLAAQSVVSLHEVAQWDILTGPVSSPLRMVIESAFEKTGGKISSTIAVNSPIMALALTSIGMGISIIDRFSVEAFPRKDIAVRLLSEPVRFQIHALMKAGQRLSAPQEAFLDEVKTEIERANQRNASA